MSGSPFFQVSLLHGLGKLGLAGLTGRVSVEGETLTVVGEKGGKISLAPGQVERMRLSRTYSRHGTFCEARFWRKGEKKPLLIPADGNDRSYAAVMRIFAAKVAAMGGMDRIYRGESRTAAILLFALTSGIAFVGAAVLIALAATSGSWAHGGGALMLIAIGLLTLRTSAWPRSIKTLADLETVLPQKGRPS